MSEHQGSMYRKMKACAFFMCMLITAGIITAQDTRSAPSEKVLESILQCAPAGIGLVRNRVIIQVNDYILDLTGYTREELIGKDAGILYPTQEEYEYVGTEKYRQIAEKGTGSVETRWLRKDGSIRNVLLSSTPLDQTNLEMGVTFTVLDITERKSIEDALLNRTLFQESLFNAIPVSVYVKDSEGRYLGCNERYTDIMGLKTDDIKGLTDYEVLPGKSGEINHQKDIELMDNPAYTEYEDVITDKEGTKRPVIVSKQVYYDSNGEAAGIVGSFLDVTEQKQLQRSLQTSIAVFIFCASMFSLILLYVLLRLSRSLKKQKEATEEMESFFSVNLDLLCIADLEGNFIKTNNAWSTILGYSNEDLNARKFIEFIHPDDIQDTLNTMADLGRGNDVLNFTNRYRCSDGSYRYIEWRSHPRGNLIFAAARDITQRIQSEQKLKESEKRYRMLFENMNAGFALHEMIYDEKGKPVDYRYIELNPMFEKLTGVKGDDYIGHTIKEMMPGIEQYWIDTYGRVSQTGESTAYQNYARELGKYFDTFVFSPEKGKFAVFFIDITERKQAEIAKEAAQRQLESKNKELEQLLYVASHDLRSPLVNVDGFSRELELSIHTLIGLMENKPDPSSIEETCKAEFADMEKSIYRIRSSTRQMDNLLKSLLKLSRAGKVSLQITIVDMYKIMEMIASSFAFRLNEKGITLKYENLPSCMGDYVQVTQVFSNIIDNAVKYSRNEVEGLIMVRGEQRGDYAVYTIEDNGIGIEKEYIDKIFELFYRVNSKKAEGEGLGLTMVRQILSRMGGDISVSSKPGEGSIFSVSLPAVKENDA